MSKMKKLRHRLGGQGLQNVVAQEPHAQRRVKAGEVEK